MRATPSDREPLVLLALTAALLALSAVRPHDYFTWLLEVAPVLIAAPILVLTYRRFRFTPLAYRLMTVHAAILMVGGHYTYAEVPLGYVVQHALHLARNDYDRLGHFAQGFVPAVLARELLLRLGVLAKRGGWLVYIVLSICLAISALYELIEWRTAVATGSAATAFLGTQGDPWDTQWDMFTALLGASTALLLVARAHDRSIARIEATRA